jgi:hypothetical protein
MATKIWTPKESNWLMISWEYKLLFRGSGQTFNNIFPNMPMKVVHCKRKKLWDAPQPINRISKWVHMIKKKVNSVL